MTDHDIDAIPAVMGDREISLATRSRGSRNACTSSILQNCARGLHAASPELLSWVIKDALGETCTGERRAIFSVWPRCSCYMVHGNAEDAEAALDALRCRMLRAESSMIKHVNFR